MDTDSQQKIASLRSSLSIPHRLLCQDFDGCLKLCQQMRGHAPQNGLDLCLWGIRKHYVRELGLLLAQSEEQRLFIRAF